MKRNALIPLLVIIFSYSSYSQHNMLGKSQGYICSFYMLSENSQLKIDTVNRNLILLTYKTQKKYPYFTYEIDLEEDRCTSYGIVSKNSKILGAYLEMLDYLGEVVDVDSTFKNFVYKVSTKEKTSFFSIQQPYINSPFLKMRDLFYILVTEEEKTDKNSDLTNY